MVSMSDQKDSIAIATLFKQLENQPRTKEGVWWHKEIYAWQVWLDGIYMGLPFYTMAAPWLRPGEEMDYYNDAVDQIKKPDQRTYDEETRLWKHAWDETHSIFWPNPRQDSANTPGPVHWDGSLWPWWRFSMFCLKIMNVA